MQKRLICLPFAGGSSVWYARWKRYFSPDIQLFLPELAGRSSRYYDPFYNTFAEAVEDVFSQISPCVYQDNYFIFGHSMGAVLAYEIAYKIQTHGYPPPTMLFFSGRLPPDCVSLKRKIHTMPLSEFKEEIMSLGGTTSNVFDEKELHDIFVPIMRADYHILEDYQYISRDERLPCDISVFYGLQDKQTPETKLTGWENHTKKKCSFFPFDGGHFFIKDREREVTDRIYEILMSYPD